MHECSKAVRRRLSDPAFLGRYLRGDGLDLSGDEDALHLHRELLPLVRSLRTLDIRGEEHLPLPDLADESFDFVHNCGFLVRTDDPRAVLREWFRLVRSGGHLIFTVPDEDLYEQGQFPSANDPRHRCTATIYKERSWSPRSWNVLDLVKALGPRAELLKLELCHETFRRELTRRDQTLSPLAECVIEVVLRKRPQGEADSGGLRPQPAPVHGAVFSELGDAWAMVSQLLKESRDSGQELLLSRYSQGNADLGPLLRAILDSLDLPGARVTLSDLPRNTERHFSVCTHPGPYVPTRVRWSPERAAAGGQGCYQLESRRFLRGAYADRKGGPNDAYRLLPEDLLAELLRRLPSLSLPMVPIGQHLGVAGSIEVASTSRFFLGIDSGMSHLCHSVGVPVYLYEGRGPPYNLAAYHPGKRYETFRSLDDLEGILRRHS